MQKFVKVISGLALVFSAAALASGDMYMQPVSYAKSGFNIGVEGGYGYINSPENYLPENTTIFGVNFNKDVDIGNFVWGVHAGYDWLVSPNAQFGVQLGYKDFLNNKYDWHISTPATNVEDISRKITQRAIDLLLTGHYYVWQGFNVFAQAGIADVYSATDTTIEPALPVTGFDGNHSIWRFKPEVGVGAGYTFNTHVNVYAHYTHIGINDDSSIEDHLTMAKVYSTDSIWAGVSYTF